MYVVALQLPVWSVFIFGKKVHPVQFSLNLHIQVVGHTQVKGGTLSEHLSYADLNTSVGWSIVWKWI